MARVFDNIEQDLLGALRGTMKVSLREWVGASKMMNRG